MTSTPDEDQAYISSESLQELLRVFQVVPTTQIDDVDDDEQENNPQEFAGMQLWDISCSRIDCESLLELNIVEICCGIISSDTDNHSRIMELAAGILSNIAVHKPFRDNLKKNVKLLKVSSECYLMSSDTPTLAELTRLFSVLLRPWGHSSSGVDQSEGDDDVNRSQIEAEFSSILAAGIISKASWVIHSCLDLSLLGRTCEFFLLLSFYESNLFKCLVKDEDCKLAVGISEMAKNFLEDFQTLEQGTVQTGYVIDLIESIADEISLFNPNLLPLHDALPSLAECIISQSLTDNVIDKAVSCLTRLHQDVRKTVDMPIEPDLALPLVHMLTSSASSRPCIPHVLDLLAYQLNLEKTGSCQEQQPTSQLVIKHADSIRSIVTEMEQTDIPSEIMDILRTC